MLLLLRSKISVQPRGERVGNMGERENKRSRIDSERQGKDIWQSHFFQLGDRPLSVSGVKVPTYESMP